MATSRLESVELDWLKLEEVNDAVDEVESDDGKIELDVPELESGRVEGVEVELVEPDGIDDVPKLELARPEKIAEAEDVVIYPIELTGVWKPEAAVSVAVLATSVADVGMEKDEDLELGKVELESGAIDGTDTELVKSDVIVLNVMELDSVWPDELVKLDETVNTMELSAVELDPVELDTSDEDGEDGEELGEEFEEDPEEESREELENVEGLGLKTVILE